jgi:2-dehydro-3-deoxyglucarate aldolase/4-hydroxy-2-oxoheptanedioate aldolase
MRKNPVRQILHEGDVAIGTMVFEFGTPGIGRIAEAAGADFVLFDQEHTPWGLETLASAMAVMRFTRSVPLVRVPTLQSHLISRLLDAGALGVMVPLIETPEQASRIVEAAKYPPLGRRGVSGGLAHDDYRGDDVGGAMRQANAETLLIAQIETAEGVKRAREIAAVEGIDVLWMGQMDLSTSLGVPGQYTHPAYLAALRAIIHAAEAAGKAAGFLAFSHEEGLALAKMGFRCIAYRSDIGLYRDALSRGIADLRSGQT